MKEESEKAGFKLNIQDHGIWSYHFMANRWGKVKKVADFIFLGSKITADGDCCHVIKRCLLPGRKAMTNLERILKSRDITLLTKVHIIKAMVFPVAMYGWESWTKRRLNTEELMLVNDGAGEDSWESHKEVKAVHPKGNQPWAFIGRTDAEADAPIFSF